jgi:hypothetical protein
VAPVEQNFRFNSDVIFISVSVDVSKDLWLKSIETKQYTQPDSDKVINLHTGGVGSRHPIIKHYNIAGYPRPLLIGKDGRIFCSDYPTLRKFEGLISQINCALSQKR